MTASLRFVLRGLFERGQRARSALIVLALGLGLASFGALPRQAWTALGIVELACTVGLIVPGVFHWRPALTVVAAAVLAVESLVFIWVHVKYREIPPIVMSAVLGLLMAFIAYGRMALKPL